LLPPGYQPVGPPTPVGPPPVSYPPPPPQCTPGVTCCPWGTWADAGGQCQPLCADGATDKTSVALCTYGFKPPPDPAAAQNILANGTDAEKKSFLNNLGCKTGAVNPQLVQVYWAYGCMANSPMGIGPCPVGQQLQPAPASQVTMCWPTQKYFQCVNNGQ